MDGISAPVYASIRDAVSAPISWQRMAEKITGPPKPYIVYLPLPNSGDLVLDPDWVLDPSMHIGGYQLPAECEAYVPADGFWFDLDTHAPITRHEIEILARDDVNNRDSWIFLSLAKGLVVYSSSLSFGDAVKIYNWMFKTLDFDVDLYWGESIGQIDDDVDYSAGRIFALSLEMQQASSAITSDTLICGDAPTGGLYARAGGVIGYTDGTNWANFYAGPFSSGDAIQLSVSAKTAETMQMTVHNMSDLHANREHAFAEVWDMSETSPDWGLSSIDSGETGEFVSTIIDGRSGRFAHLLPAAGSASAHADIYRGVIGTAPVDYPAFALTDVFTLAVNAQQFGGDDNSNANPASTTPYIDVRFSSAASMERGGLFRLMRMPGWQYINLLGSDFTIASGGEVITNDMVRAYIRAFNNATTGGQTEFYLGPLWLNAKDRPRLIIELDDGWLSTYTQAFPYCQVRGVNLSVPLAAEAVGTNDAVYCNWAQVEEMYAAGFDFLVHGNKSHGVDLLNYQQVYDDTVDKIARMESHGISSRHYVYPQGRFNSSYSFDALTDAGIISSAHTAGGALHSTAFGVCTPLMLPRAPMNHTIGSAAIITQINRAVSLGTTLRLYGHKVLGSSESVSNSDLELTYAEFTSIIDAAVALRDAGTLDIVTVSEWWGTVVEGKSLPTDFTTTTQALTTTGGDAATVKKLFACDQGTSIKKITTALG